MIPASNLRKPYTLAVRAEKKYDSATKEKFSNFRIM